MDAGRKTMEMMGEHDRFAKFESVPDGVHLLN